jgi:hypothetical protein
MNRNHPGTMNSARNQTSNSRSKMNNDPSPVFPVDETSEPAAPQPERSRSRWKTVAYIIVFLALAGPGLYSFFSKPGEEKTSATNAPVTAPSRSALLPGATAAPPAVDWTARKKQIRRELALCLKAASNEEAAVWRKFAADLEAREQRNSKALDEGVDNAVDTLCQADQIGWLVADFARDKVQGGQRAKTRIEACSSVFLKATKESSVRTRELLLRLQGDLQAVNNRYAAAVGEVLDDAKFQLPPSDYRQLASTYQSLPTQIIIEVVGTSVAVGIEVAMARTTIKMLVELFAKLLGPQIAKAAAALGVSVADGPLPIGDIIGVALAAWTVHDVVVLPGKIRKEVRESFESARNAQLDQLGNQVLSAVQQLRRATAPPRLRLHKQLLAGL